MVHKRVQIRHDESDIEENFHDWSDIDDEDEEGDYEGQDMTEGSESDAPEKKSAGKADGDSDASMDSASEAQHDNEVSSESEDEDDSEGDVTADLATVSFGALAKAQRSLKRKRDDPDDGSVGDDDLGNKSGASNGRGPRNAARFAGIKDQLKSLSADSKSNFAESLKKAREKRDRGKGTQEVRSRSSKHAPTEMSSKKAVSRRRTVVDLPADTTRDPRFDQAGASRAVDLRRVEKTYAFLDDYRDSEIKALRQEVAKEKNPIRKEELQKALQSLVSVETS
ncbi:hypothetical protein ABW19_dt0205730 [Dactylella cylindrospora]|nr:hypothetical protein ABW19_dt0205730 [Dactylella cylindrospora]